MVQTQSQISIDDILKEVGPTTSAAKTTAPISVDDVLSEVSAPSVSIGDSFDTRKYLPRSKQSTQTVADIAGKFGPQFNVTEKALSNQSQLKTGIQRGLQNPPDLKLTQAAANQGRLAELQVKQTASIGTHADVRFGAEPPPQLTEAEKSELTSLQSQQQSALTGSRQQAFAKALRANSNNPTAKRLALINLGHFGPITPDEASQLGVKQSYLHNAGLSIGQPILEAAGAVGRGLGYVPGTIGRFGSYLEQGAQTGQQQAVAQRNILGKSNTLGSVVSGASQMIPDLVAAGIIGPETLTGQAATFGGIGAVQSFGRGESLPQVAESGILNAAGVLSGHAIGALAPSLTEGPFKQVAIRVLGNGGLGYTLAAAQGGDLQAKVSSAILFGAQGFLGGGKKSEAAAKTTADLMKDSNVRSVVQAYMADSGSPHILYGVLRKSGLSDAAALKFIDAVPTPVDAILHETQENPNASTPSTQYDATQGSSDNRDSTGSNLQPPPAQVHEALVPPISSSGSSSQTSESPASQSTSTSTQAPVQQDAIKPPSQTGLPEAFASFKPTDSFIDSMWERLTKNKPLMGGDRPGTLEYKIQVAYNKGEIKSPDDIRPVIDQHFNKGGPPNAPNRINQQPNQGVPQGPDVPTNVGEVRPQESSSPGSSSGPERQAIDFDQAAQDSTQKSLGLGGPEAGAVSQTLMPHEQLNTFVTKDPVVQSFIKGVPEAIKWVVNKLSPTTGVDSDVLSTLSKMKGTREEQTATLQKVDDVLRKTFDSMPQSQQIGFIDFMKQGRKQPTPELQSAADFYRELDNNLWIEVNKRLLTPNGIKTLAKVSSAQQIEFLTNISRGLPQSTPALDALAVKFPKASATALVDYLDNHFRVLWKDIPGPAGQTAPFSTSTSTGLGRRPLAGTEGSIRYSHTLPDMSEGINRGGTPVSYNPATLFELSYGDAYKFITAQDMWKGIEKQRVFIKPGERPPEGYRTLDDRIAQKYFRTQYGLTKAGQWYIEDGPARLLENYLSPDAIRGNPIGQGLMATKNFYTAIELGFSPFHAVFESIETMGSSLGLGLQKIWNQGIVGLGPSRLEGIRSGLQDIAATPFRAYTNAKLGARAIRYLVNESTAAQAAHKTFASPEAFIKATDTAALLKTMPDAPALLKDLFPAGAKLEMDENYRISTARTFKEAVNQDNFIGAALRAIPALGEIVQGPLFNKFIPSLKVGMWLREYSNALVEHQTDLTSGKLTRPELARQTWSFVEDRLGEMNFDNLWWNRTMKSALQLGFRSVTWKLGNARASLGVGADAVSQAKNILTGAGTGSGPVQSRIPKITPRIGWLLGTSAVVATMGTIVMAMFAHKNPEEVKDLLYPQVDPKDPNQRIALPSYFRDYASFYHSPSSYLGSSAAGSFRDVYDVWRNERYDRSPIHYTDDPWVKQRLNDLGHLLPEPISVQSLLKDHKLGASPARTTLDVAGFGKAPTYLSYSPGMEMMFQLLDTRRDAPKTRREFEMKQKVRELFAQKRGGVDITQTAAAARNSGQISEGQRQALNSRRSLLQAEFGRLNPTESTQVFPKLSPSEQSDVRGVYDSKVRQIKGVH